MLIHTAIKILALLCSLALPALAGASGNISSTNKYAWSETGGWSNFAPTGDGGATWTAATTQPVNSAIRAMAINNTDSTILYAVSYTGGAYKSTNGSGDSANNGMTWAACATQPTNPNAVTLTIDVNGKLYAGTEAGVFVSADGYGTWSAMNSGLP